MTWRPFGMWPGFMPVASRCRIPAKPLVCPWRRVENCLSKKWASRGGRILWEPCSDFGWGWPRSSKRRRGPRDSFLDIKTFSTYLSTIPFVKNAALYNCTYIYCERQHVPTSHCQHQGPRRGERLRGQRSHSLHVYILIRDNRARVEQGASLNGETAGSWRRLGWLACYATRPGQKKSETTEIPETEVRQLSSGSSCKSHAMKKWFCSPEGLIFPIHF